jgi:hypothetical protein
MNSGKTLLANKNIILILSAFTVVILGVVGAYFISKSITGGASSADTPAAPGAKVSDTEAGLLDTSVKYDEVTGELKEGGIGNEGTHHLEREGGPSKNVYLTSTVIDLDSFVGKKVQVWGQTLAAKKAGWLMDVAKIKVAQ